MRRPLALLLLILPVLVLGGWIGWLTLERAGSPSLRVAIRGFDPRDLLRGHYLEFQLDLRGEEGQSRAACLVQDPADPLRPLAGAARPDCRHPLSDRGATYRYYLPEETALRLERLLIPAAGERREDVSVIVHFAPNGRLSFSGIQIGARAP